MASFTCIWSRVPSEQPRNASRKEFDMHGCLFLSWSSGPPMLTHSLPFLSPLILSLSCVCLYFRGGRLFPTLLIYSAGGSRLSAGALFKNKEGLLSHQQLVLHSFCVTVSTVCLRLIISSLLHRSPEWEGKRERVFPLWRGFPFGVLSCLQPEPH